MMKKSAVSGEYWDRVDDQKKISNRAGTAPGSENLQKITTDASINLEMK